ncbi:MAG: hypothetical protein HDS68_04400 [Bacteroidales bacterium]|nr:hypothetical protein [Bacteroidales bacterium]
MRKIFLIAAAGMLTLVSCQQKVSDAESMEVASVSDSLRIALANQDSLLTLMNDVADGMAQIKQMENILSTTTDMSLESQDKRKQLRNDILIIHQALQMRRDRLNELETKLKKSTGDNTTLQKSIQTLKQQITDQENTIETLRSDLATANASIQKLTANVDSLNTEVASITAAKNEIEEEAATLTSELNTCYYALGSKKELKEHKLIETGFLRKTKIMPQDFEEGYFTRADKRTLLNIDLHSKKANVLTNQPKDSYEIVDTPNGSKMLKILAPARFWNTSNFLIIEID